MKKMRMSFVSGLSNNVATQQTSQQMSQQTIQQTNYTHNNNFSHNFMNTQGLRSTGCSSCSRNR
jgi:hypothetical protein